MRKAQVWIALLFFAPVLGGQGPAKRVASSPAGLTFAPGLETARIDIVVTGEPAVRVERTFDAHTSASFGLMDDSGQILADGVYSYEVREYALVERGEPTVARRSGRFEVRGGLAYLDGNQSLGQPDSEITNESGKIETLGIETLGTKGDLQVRRSADTISGNLAVTLDQCVGSGLCTDTMSFSSNVGNADVWIASSDPQILFDDLSSTGNFALEVDAGQFGIWDETANRRVVGIDTSARADSIFVGSSGTLALHTAAPAPLVELHVFSASGNNAEIRLESGSSAREWDLESTGSSFVVQDVTAGTVPFQIGNDVPNNTLYLDSAGRIGVGTSTPSSTFEIEGFSGTSQLLIDERGADANVEVMFNLVCNCAPGFRMENKTNGEIWFFRHTSAGDFSFDNVGSAGLEARLDSSGNFFIQGSLSQGSSRALKEGLELADGARVLETLDELDLYEWSYIDQTSRHFGPMAEDFSAVYGLGESATKIAPADMAGVALASAKALRADNTELKEVNAQQQEVLRSLLARVAALEKSQE